MKKVWTIIACCIIFQLHAAYERQFENDQICVTKAKILPDDETSHEIVIHIKIQCPMSAELQDFVNSIPPSGNYSSSFDAWRSSFINNMTQLILLVESGKIHNSWWSVKTGEWLLPGIKQASSEKPVY